MHDTVLPSPSDDVLREHVRALLKRNATEGYSELLNAQYCYIKPSPVKYPFQWFWDTCFHVFMLCALGESELAKRNLRSLFAMQEEDGFVGHMIFWKSVLPTARADVMQARPSLRQLRPHMSSLIQPSFVAQALLHIYEGTKDDSYLKEMLPKVKKYLEWLHRNRNFDGDGLISIISPFESGMDYKPSFDSVIGFTGDVRGRKLYWRTAWVDFHNFMRRYDLPRIYRAQKFIVKEVTVNTAYAQDLKALAELCRLANDPDADVYARRAAHVARRMMEVMFDEETMAFYDVAGPEHRKLKVLTPTIIFPALLPEIPHELFLQIMRRHILCEREFFVPYPIPSVAKSEPSFFIKDTWYLWRGPTWAFFNWFICRCLLRRDAEKEADALIETLRTLIAKSGFREYYNPFTGEGFGEKQFTWSGLVVDMLEKKRKHPCPEPYA